MLVIEEKSGSGIISPYRGDGIFDFGKILLKKALNSNLLKTASRAINSELGQTTISALKRAAQSELGQELQQRALSEVKKRALDVSNKALNTIAVPSAVKEAAQSELGKKLQKKIISQVGKTTQEATDKLGITAPIAGKAKSITQSAFQKLGIAEPTRKRKRKPKKTRGKKRKGGSFVYPQALVEQFVGSGIVLE